MNAPQPAPAAPAAPAPVAPAPELRFANEEEQQVALDKFEADGREPEPDDIAEIDRIMAAPVGDEPAAPAPTTDEPSEPAAQPTVDEPAAPAAAPAPAQPPAEPAAPAEEARKWAITEDMINAVDEKYQDRTGRDRMMITQKSPEDFLKSYVNGQRRIQYLEREGMTEAENSGYERARAESAKEIADLKAQAVAQPPAPAAPAPGAPAAPAQPAGTADLAASSNARQEFQATLESLKGMKEGEEFDNVPALLKAVTQSAAIISELDQTVTRIQTEGTEAFSKFQKEQTATSQQTETQTKQTESKKAWGEACRLIDGFVGSQTCPPELKIEQQFEIATQGVMYFHDELARHDTGKPRGEITDADRVNAVAKYLAKTPALLSKVESVGLQEPDYYRQWLVLDEVDALRNGYVRDSRTKQWTTRHSQDGGRRVQFPDMQSAYDEYRRINGMANTDVSKAVHQNTQQIVGAMATRDKGLVTMDESKTAMPGQPGVLAEEEANRKLDDLERIGGQDEALRRAAQGDLSMIEQYNIAMAGLGQEPLPKHLYERFLPSGA